MRIREWFTKRNILTAAVILLAVAVIVLILILTGRGRRRGTERFTGGADTPYPYAWTENADGTVLISPCAAVPEGYGWLVSDSDPAVVSVTERSAQGAPAFLLTPVGVGDCFFELALADAADSSDALCRLVMTVEGTKDKARSASVTGDRLELLDNVLRGGADFSAAYRIRTDENGVLELRLTDTEKAEDWRVAVRTPSTLDVSGLQQGDGAVTARLFAVSPGNAAFVMYSPARGLSLEVTGTSAGDGSLTAATHVMRFHEDWAGREDGFADAAVIAGEIAVPEGAEDVSFGSVSIARGVGAAASVQFRYLGVAWTLYIAPGDTLARILESEYAEEDAVRSFFLPAGLLLAAQEGDSVIAWCAADERTYYLEGSGAQLDTAVLLETAGCVITPAGSEDRE